MENIISFKNVSWRRDGKEILSGLNWRMNQNEHWAILGLNGSGKTSLLNIITGYQFPTAGEVSVLGNIFGKTNLPELRRNIGFVSSSLDRFTSNLNYETVEDIVLSGKFASIGIHEEVLQEDVEKAGSIVNALRLDYLKGRQFRLLSQGEKRRVFIARALMSNPKLLILDEPCTGLDILSREEVLQVMKEITGHNCHLVFVTHHIEELVEEITHTLLLRDGEIIAAGPKKDVLTDESLSETFKTSVSVRWEEDRPWLTVRKENICLKI